MKFITKQQAEAETQNIKARVLGGITSVQHPTDVVTSLRDLSRWASTAADEREKRNDRDGVPER